MDITILYRGTNQNFASTIHTKAKLQGLLWSVRDLIVFDLLIRTVIDCCNMFLPVSLQNFSKLYSGSLSIRKIIQMSLLLFAPCQGTLIGYFIAALWNIENYLYFCEEEVTVARLN